MEQRSQNSLLLSHFCILLLSIYVVAKQKFALSKVHKSTQRASVLSPKTRPLQSPNADGFIAGIKSVLVDVWAEEGKEGIHVYGALKVRYPEKWQTCAENGCPRWTQGCLVVVIWSANTERFCEVTPAVHDSEENLMKAIVEGHPEVAPSQMFAMASLLEGYSYINGSPQNTFVPAIIVTAERLRLFVGGDDFKSGQTKIKSVLVDFLVSAGIKPESIVSYNHLGNNDGKNLNAPKQFRSKEISKSNVVDDMVGSNRILFAPGEHPDHTVVIKYVPFVGDSKRAMDEYTSSIFLNGRNTIVMHNTCEDSLLAAPLIIDLVVLTELFERVEYATPLASAVAPPGWGQFRRMEPVLSLLSYLLKAPQVPRGTPVVNALFKQRAAIVNVMRACVGLPPENNMLLEHICPAVSTKKTSNQSGSGIVQNGHSNGHSNGHVLAVNTTNEHGSNGVVFV
eukprot:986190_1